jgi:siderophore synthetase component
MLSQALAAHAPGAVVSETALSRVLRQLLEALLFESCLDAVAVPNKDSTNRTIYFVAGRRNYACNAKVRGFGRIRLDIHTLVTLEAGKQRPPAPLEMLYEVLEAVPGDREAKNRLTNELLQSIYWTQWNHQHLPQTSRRHMGFAALETHLWEGHPYHPCFKARSGFSESDHRLYSSDCGQKFQLRWLAVHRRYARWNFPQSPVDFYKLQGCAGLISTCRQLGHEPDEYLWVPVHPWQWRNHLAEKIPFVSEGEMPAIVDLGFHGDFYRATQSQRTLMNVSRPGAADIKLPLDIVCTSSRRHLLSHSICAAPIISRWLSNTVEQDVFFAEYPLVILQEFAGLLVDCELYNPGGDISVSQLSVLWRDNITAVLREGERAVPMTALLATEWDDLPFVQHWVEEYGLKPWLEQLLRVVVTPVWHLLACHGLAVEAHAQNAILIHRDGWPVRLALRDFHESFEYVPEFVGTPDNIPDFANFDPVFATAPADQYYWMAQVDALRELYMDTLYIFHLSDLAFICERHYGLTESKFWAMAEGQLRNYAAHDWCAPARLRHLAHNAPKIRAESLVRKKLWNQPASEYHHWVENPFAEMPI